MGVYKSMDDVQFYEDPSCFIRFSDKMEEDELEPEATIHVLDNGHTLYYFFICNNGVILGDWHTHINYEVRKEMLNILEKKIYGISSTNDKYNKDRLKNLSGFGIELFKKLIPKELSEEINKLPAGKLICISTNERWIPWEILHDGHNFLGKRFLVFRLPRIDANSQINSNNSNYSSNSSRNELQIDKIVIHIIGENIDENLTRKAKEAFVILKKDTGINVHEIERTSLLDLMKTMNAGDILHFTCHGHNDPCYLQLTKEKNPEINLTIESFRNEDFKIKKGCSVFVNACGSADSTSILGEFSNFGIEFYKKGSKFFIGTLGCIPTEYAIEFAEEFYKSLSSVKIFPIAFKKTKRLMNQKYDDSKIMDERKNILCVLYIIYGNPKYALTN